MKDIKFIRPDDLKEFWERNLQETLEIKNEIIVDHIDPQDFGSLIYFYFLIYHEIIKRGKL